MQRLTKKTRRALWARPVSSFITPTTKRQTDYREYLRSEHWKLFRHSIFCERGKICQQCGSTRKIQIHHLIYERLGREIPSDVAVLCDPCHAAIHQPSIASSRNR